MMFSIIIIVSLATTGTTTAAPVGVLYSSSTTASKSNQTANEDGGISGSSTIQHTKNQQTYNATENMIVAFKTADSLLIQALNNLNKGKTREALSQLNSAKIQIEQYQLAALDAMSNPVLQISREHLLAAEQALKMGNTDQAISELNMLRQLRILHQQGMMIMNLPMAGEMNSTFNSLESHLLAADENINGYNVRGAISELNLATDQLYAHQLAMLDVVYSFLNSTRTHLKQSITDINLGNIQGAISELKMVNQLLRGHEQGMLMIVGRMQPPSNLL
ncbi:MAG: hypothetical protein ACJ71P_18370 [Nitrososphaeraceae archaeon]